MSTTSNPVPALCTICDLTFSGLKKLRKHKAEVHPPSLPCSACSLTFSKAKSLRSHKREMHPLSHSCKKCLLTFPTKKLLGKHNREAHPPSFSCHLCDSQFSNERKVRLHKVEVHVLCKYCSTRFKALEDLRAHQRETGHLHCQECDLYFPNKGEHITHIRNIQHITEHHCCDCDREYPSQDALNNHCCDCDKVFLTNKILTKHFSKPKHIRKLEFLAAATNLEPRKDRRLFPRCETCKEDFSSQKILKKHVSSMHKPPRNISCPVGSECVKKFATPSALLNHLESGGCRAGMTRTKMAELVFTHDTNRYITSIDAVSMFTPEAISTSEIVDSSSLIASPRTQLAEDFTSLALRTSDEDTTSEWSILNDNGVLLTPTSESASDWSLIHGGAQLTPDLLSANMSEWSFAGDENPSTTLLSPTNRNISSPSMELLNQKILTCNLCPPTRKPFSNFKALEAHINSVAHAPKIFHCPLLSFMADSPPVDSTHPGSGLDAKKVRKKKTFSTLAALTQHLESGACEGGVDIYKKALVFVESQLMGLGFAGGLLLGNSSA